jgi:putative flippase GtrA
MGYLVFIGSYFILRKHLHYLGILLVAHILAVLNAFLGHKFLTFKAQGHLFADFLRFNLAYLGVLVFSLAGLPFLVEVCRLHPLASQAILTALSMAGSYLLHKKVSFRRT